MKFTEQTMQDIANSLLVVDGAFDSAATWLGVFTAISQHGQDTVLADLTEGTGGLAARQQISGLGGPYRMADGRWYLESEAQVFRVADDTEPQIVLGWFLVDDDAGGQLLAWEFLPQPVPLNDQFDNLTIVIRYTIDPDGRWNSAVTYDG